MMTRIAVTHFALLGFLVSVPVGAATVEFHRSVLEKTPATLGIPSAGVPTRAVKAYRADRASMKARASTAFANNPVAVKVRNHVAEETENRRAVKFRNGPVQFEISKAAGAEMLMDLDRYTHREQPVRAIDESTLERDARRYISAHMTAVEPKELSFTGVKKIMNSVARIDANGKPSAAKTEVANYIVMFHRKIDNIPVVGPGESIRVYLSSNGEVIGHSKIWREIDHAAVSQPRPVVPPARVQDALKRSLADHPAPRVVVDFFEFGYLGEGRYTAQETLKPVYLIGYTAGPETKRAIKIYDAYTGAEIPPPPDPKGSNTK